MANYPYMALEEKWFIEQNYLRKRKSKDSQKNISILLGVFTNFIKKGLFSADKTDAEQFLAYLEKKKANHEYKEEYCKAILIELKNFYQFAYERGEMSYNPFDGLTGSFKSKEVFKVNDIPSLSEIDKLLTLTKVNPMLHMAVLLAFRMALPINEIANLKKVQFCYENNSSKTYLCMERLTSEGKKNVYLLVPEDIVPQIKETYDLTSDAFPYLLRNAKGRSYSTRTLQANLKDIEKGTGLSITFSDIRSLSIYLLLAAKAPLDAIANYVGVEGRWLTKYDQIPDDRKYKAIDYVNIRIV